MATTKILKGSPKSHASVARLIQYVINPDKTTNEKSLFVSSCNCSVPGAADQFKLVRDNWGKNFGNFAYHLEQSFKPGELSPEEAHQCGKEFAEALLGQYGYQVVFATHLDRQHLHNHFVVNAVNPLTGKKLQTNHEFIRKMREENDRICRLHNLSVIEEPKNHGKSYAEWIIDKKGGFTWRGMIREDIDSLIPTVTTLKALLQALEKSGYTVQRRGKYLTVSPPGTEVHFRLYKLGKGYTEEDITKRILYYGRGPQKESGLKPTKVKYHAKLQGSFSGLHRKGGFRGLYYSYVYKLRRLLSAPPAHQSRMPAAFRRDSKLLRDFVSDLQLLSDYKIDELPQLIEVYEQLQKEKKSLCSTRLTLRNELEISDSTEELINLHEKITGINTQIQSVTSRIKACERIYQRSTEVKKTNRQINHIQKGLDNLSPDNQDKNKNQSTRQNK